MSFSIWSNKHPGIREIFNNNMSCLASNSAASCSLTLNTAANNDLNQSDSSIDNFLSDIIANVTSHSPKFCTSCEESFPASSRCLDCCEFLCASCARTHARLRQNHRVKKLSTSQPLAVSPPVAMAPPIAVPSPISVPPPIAVASNSRNGEPSQIPSPNKPNVNFCVIHREPLRLFCQSCNSAACTECVVADHCGHQLIYMEDAIVLFKKTSQKLLNEACQGISVIRQSKDNIQRMYESVERRSIQTATEVRTIMKRYVASIEQREVELLKRIDQTRQVKGNLLIAQMENLRAALSKLTRISETLNDSIDGNPCDLAAINERAANELKQLRALRPDIIPCEDDSIVFLPPDKSLLRATSLMGNLAINVDSMSSRIVRAATTREQHIFVKLPRELLAAPLKNRAIYGSAHVSVKNHGRMPSLTFGTEGEEDGKLCRPWGVCCDSSGHIIIADRSNNRIQVFSPSGVFLYKFGTSGTRPGQFDRPAGITINPEGNIVVADKDNHRIQIFTIDGKFLMTFGERGSRNGQFNYPWDVACNAMGQICVSDTRNHRIQLFTPDGVFLTKYGFEGCSTMWKHFDSPRGVCFTPKGSVVVSDFNNHKLVVIDKHFVQAQFLGQEGSNHKQFLRPQGVAVDDSGNIVVADSRNHRVQVFESNGNFMWKLGQPGTGVGDMDRPSGVCFNPDGRIVVVDFGNNRMQVF